MAMFRTLRLTNNILICNVPRFELPGSVIRGRISALGRLNIGIRAGVIVNEILSVSRLVSSCNFRSMFVNSNTNLPEFVGVPNRGLYNICSTGRFLAEAGLVGTCGSSDAAPVVRTGGITIINNNGITVSTTHYTGHLNTRRICVICEEDRRRLPTHGRRIRRTGRRKVVFGLLGGPIRVLNGRSRFMANVGYVGVRLNRPSTDNEEEPIRVPNDRFVLSISTIIVSVNASPGPLVGTAAGKLSARG